MNLPPTGTLSASLEEAIRHRRVKAAVFTTYTLEPGFFEEEVLPLLFDQGWSHMPKVRLVQLEEKIVKVEGGIAVYYDRDALLTSGTPALLDVRRYPVSRNSGGCFHPKLILLILEEHDEETDEKWDVLLVGVLSANLTRAGWWENVECAVFQEFAHGEHCSLKKDLLELMKHIRKEVSFSDSHDSLERIRKFLHYSVSTPPRRVKKGCLYPRLFVGQEPLGEFLTGIFRHYEKTFNLEIVSPYFDKDVGVGTIKALMKTLVPKSTRIYLPLDDQGVAACDEAYFQAVERLPHVRWSKLPHSLVQRSKQATDTQTDRFVHAKIYRFWSKKERREFLLIGSANLTRPGHSRVTQGNLEASLLLEVPDPGMHSYWLTPVDEQKPTKFAKQNSTEEDSSEGAPPLVIRFDWDRGLAEYYWDQEKSPRQVTLLSLGVEKTKIQPVRSRTWIKLDSAFAEVLSEVLKTTSFLEILVDGKPRGMVMVCEEGMAHKPPLIMNLTPEEILKYWAMLTPEQRENFLGRVLAGLIGGTGYPPVPKTQDSLFDRFAGIFHAFSRLEEHVEKALEEDHLQEAEYRLFGEKHDSLPVFVQKVLDDEEDDSVNRYVKLLTARQLVHNLENSWPEFFDSHHRQKERLDEKLKRIDEIRDSLDLGRREEKDQFLNWFERMFLARAEPEESI